MYIRTSVSRTVTVSVCRTVNEPIQQHTGVHYHIRLRCDCDELPSPKNCYSSLFFRCPTPFQKPNAVYFLWLSCIQLSVLKVSDEKKNFVFIELEKVNLILLTE